jgi:hypothetical protein
MATTYRPLIVAICGYKRSGKDTIADYMAFKFNFKKVHIADPVKDACAALFNLNQEQLHGDLKDVEDPSWGVSPRRILQFFGTELMQYHIQGLLPNIGRNFWIKSFCAKISNDLVTPIVIPDVRFHHEIEYLRRTFGSSVKLIKIINDRVCHKDDHISEKEWLEMQEDTVIINNGSFDDLYTQIDTWIINQN